MRSFFVAATGQDVGKTTICLGLISALRKKIKSVAFMKPVGQEHIQIETGDKVDKDVLLFKKTFSLKSSYQDMSPVLFPRGFTRDFLDGNVATSKLVEHITKSFKSINQNNDMTVIEGTGHTGVGSIVDLNNAQVAKLLNSPMILVASGGLGSSFDELSLNLNMCEKYGVKVAGIILNRVLIEKREMILKYVPLALKRWNIPLLGSVPYHSFLSYPTMRDFESLFQTEILTGLEHAMEHFEHIRIAASSLEVFQSNLVSGQLIITPAVREDILLTVLTHYWDIKISDPENNSFSVGLILTGREPPKNSVVTQIQKAKIPMLYVPMSNFFVMKMINTYTLKIRKDDPVKINEAIQIVESHIDFEKLEKALQL